MTVLIGVLILVLAVVGGVAYGAMRNKRAFAKQNEIIAGTASRAPAPWAGAHTPEALLHRRLRAAVDGARAQLSTGGASLDDVVAAISRGAQDLDDRLIAAAALPAAADRTAAITALEPPVAALEHAVAGLSSALPGTAQTEIDAAVADAHERLGALAEARAEVDLADTATPQTLPRLQIDPRQPTEPQAQTLPPPGG